ncbi:MAG: hypothetical protein A2946_01525 [Candidatus Liptonbacteria bacterium RIFCSPLOWO2_01_FULL_53_13]|uniref:MobA-like NTP transferase domain-containing protein n=1 Tax=Candidatus Liptonbacteria bacterium RIFCSPLOWO2_01_FULL_53_13 TaxID=1798651 RepID=A0A1G2CQ68_9BACT|nr:MAG: hypothetical protein A2946_01525 [Candidatus Liptonbacteria bacterium RIFCSPLOWO2_01_FULL_53_13]
MILAAGKGVRMKSETPKVLQDLNGRPIISYLADSVLRAGIDPSPVVVIAKDGDTVRETLGEQFTYVVQDEQLGTGHAVQCAETSLRENGTAIMVLYGDHPFVSAETIKKLSALYASGDAPLAMMTVKVSDFDDWRAAFYDWGRIVRSADRNIKKIVEKKDATPEELAIREVNPSFFCFRADWLWAHLPKLTARNAQGEYYLVDLVQMAVDEGAPIASMDIDPKESIGVNTQEHLELARKMM